MPPLLARLVYSAVQQPLLVLVVLFLGCLAIFTLGSVRSLSQRLLARHGILVATTVAVGLVVLYVAGVLWYAWLPGFAGEVEPTVASISWAAQEGYPLYHQLEDASRYSVLYGPMAFLTNGIVMRVFGPSMLSAKLAGAFAALLTLLFLFLALRPRVGTRVGLMYVAGAILFFFIHGPFSYLSRPDPFLLTSVSFGLLVATRARRALAVVGIAVALAFSINLKFHAFLYFLPILVLIGQRFGVRSLVMSLTIGGGLTLAPFLFFDNISLANYIIWLREASRHGLDAATFSKTARFALFFSAPAFLFLSPRRQWHSPLRGHALYASALAVATPILLVFASKPGAGLNHLLPLLPHFIWISAAAFTARRDETPNADWFFTRPRLSGVTAVVLSTLFIAGVVEVKCIQKLREHAANGAAITADIDEVLDTYGSDFRIGMACGGEGRNYSLSFYRTQLIFAGHPLLMDVIAVMEGQRSGREIPAQMIDALASGEVDMWLVPRGGVPFQKNNWYPPHQPVFPPSFLAMVQDRYDHVLTTDFFDVWVFEDHPALAGGRFDVVPARAQGGATPPPRGESR